MGKNNSKMLTALISFFHPMESFITSRQFATSLKKHLAVLVTTSFLGYLVLIIVYRLFFSRLAHIPGPRLAAATRLYEFYYDVILRGRFTMKIQELHKQYGELLSFQKRHDSHLK